MTRVSRNSTFFSKRCSHNRGKKIRYGISQVQTVIIVLGVILIAFISIFPLLGINPWTPGEFNFPFGGDINEVDEERKAIIVGEEAEIRLTTFNGEIKLKPTSSDEFRVQIKIRGTEEGIDNIEIDFSDDVGQDGEQVITLTAKRLRQLSGQSEMVQLEAEVPSEVSYSLDLSTSNGDIELEGMKGHDLDIDTSNGRIILEDVDFRSLDIETSNGRVISSDGLRSDNAKIQTSNGNIDVKINGEGEYDIDTSNGRIEISIALEIPTRVDAQTSVGGVDWNKTPIDIIESSRNRLIAETEDYDRAEEKISLNLRTSNGSIEINSPD
jgi:DUF4097 and DUF4098 domain-containing protein YvlB